jgi:beta-N-acetylhexosaminidase
MTLPHWPAYPSGAHYGRLAARNLLSGLEATRLGLQLIAHDLARVGIDVDCVPLLDVPVQGAHDVIGARAFGRDPAFVIPLARAAAEGVLVGGVLPVIKHMPGHGRAGVDSHHHLPRVDASLTDLRRQDFAPFRALRDLPMAMSAHVVFEAIDPTRPATTSPTVIADILRGEIGFDGLLMTDDLSMNALGGTIGERAEAAIAAGCDMVLHCNGQLDEMQAVAAAVPALAGLAAERAMRALAWRKPTTPFDRAAAEQRFAVLMAETGFAFRPVPATIG